MAIKIGMKFGAEPRYVWVDWKDGARVKLRDITRSEEREIRRQCTEETQELRDGRYFNREKFDDVTYDRLRYDRMIADWEGFVDVEGTDIPCTTETKFGMMDGWHEFFLFVTIQAAKYQKLLAEQEAALTENLSDSQSGKKASRAAKNAKKTGPGNQNDTTGETASGAGSLN